ncbi:hypothetical protein [Schaalia cardiffensis]|uniref:hypothetical protein n=1 Tax=Schaalia cardiffensis TaxID=181487 RepID=UPI0023F147A6|nr:hypothetical protein [Schaalia cardiffensis]
MTPQEAAIVLAKCSAFDNRQPSQAAATAWGETIDEDVTLQDALTIVRDHYANSRDWIMPADINRISRQLRRQRITTVIDNRVIVPEGLGDEPALEAEWRARMTRAVGDGLTLDEAKAQAWREIHRLPPPELPESPRTIRPQLRKA